MRSRKVCRSLSGSALTDEELNRSTWDRCGPLAQDWSRDQKERFHDAHVPPTKDQVVKLLEGFDSSLADLARRTF